VLRDALQVRGEPQPRSVSPVGPCPGKQTGPKLLVRDGPAKPTGQQAASPHLNGQATRTASS